MKRTAFFVSDSTGITVEALGHSLLAQFDKIDFEHTTIPYINSAEKARAAVDRINQESHDNQIKPIIFSSLVDPRIREIISQANGIFLDVFNIFLGPLENAMNTKSTQVVGKSHGIPNLKTYETRIDAVHYAIDSDDGSNIKNYDMADIILVGVSRCGKTPTCLYMALQFGIYAANYPITDEDMHSASLPKVLQPYVSKLFGLIISPQRLHAIREERRPNSNYSSLKQCQYELQHTEELFKKTNIPYLNSTSFSIEEISTKIIQEANIKRRLF